MTRLYVSFVVTSASLLGALYAQEAHPVALGARVRILSPEPSCRSVAQAGCYRKVVGTLTSLDSLSIVVRREDGEVLSLPRVSGTRLDVSTGQSLCIHRGSCIVLGFVGGAAVGELVWTLILKPHEYCVDDPCGLFELVSFSSGAVLGTIIGAVLPAEHWRQTTAPVHLGIAPEGARRFAVGVSLSL